MNNTDLVNSIKTSCERLMIISSLLIIFVIGYSLYFNVKTNYLALMLFCIAYIAAFACYKLIPEVK